MSFELNHHQVMANGISLHYVVVGRGVPLLLIHGFPQTWHQWLPLIERLAGDYRIIAPDLPGIGAGPGPATGYDKHSFAEDIRAVIDLECRHEPMLVCGHNVGAFVAFAYALKYPALVDGLMLIDAPPPGTTLWDAGINSERASTIRFQSDVESALLRVTGHERAYIRHFIESRACDASAIGPEELDLYAAAYSAPGALRAAFEMCRALSEDSALNKRALVAGKLPMPVTLVGASGRLTRIELQQTLDEIALRGRVEIVPRSGHWIAQEQPDALAALIRGMTDNQR